MKNPKDNAKYGILGGRPRKNMLAQEIFDLESPEIVQLIAEKLKKKKAPVPLQTAWLNKAIVSKTESKVAVQGELKTSPLLEALKTVYPSENTNTAGEVQGAALPDQSK